MPGDPGALPPQGNFCMFVLLGRDPPFFLFGLRNSVSEKAMAPHSSTLAWKIPRAEEPGRLQSMGSLRVGHD